jgi:hypothetical protein
MLSPPPGVALPVCTAPSKQIVTFVPVGAEGSGLIVTADVVLLQVVDVLVKVNVTLPAETPVTTPVPATTVATPGVLLTHVPPLFGVKFIELPIHRFAEGVLTTGNAFTVATTDVRVLVHVPLSNST